VGDLVIMPQQSSVRLRTLITPRLFSVTWLQYYSRAGDRDAAARHDVGTISGNRTMIVPVPIPTPVKTN
jgi:hypothetical protein